MIIVSYLFFYLLRNHKKTFLHLIVPFFILFVYGYSLADGQAISSWYSDRGNIIICRALLRAAAAMSVGALCYLAYTKLKEAKLSRAAVIILSMVEFFLYLLVLAVSAKSYAYDVYLVAALAFAVTLSFSLKKHSSLWNCKLIRTFSDISYAIFLNHW